MQQGNWIPLSKALVKYLPLNREYSEIEAMFSLTVDYDNSNSASVSGYATLWGWSRKRVSNFLKRYDLSISYKDKFNRHKKGQVGYQEGNRKGTGREQVEFIDSKALSVEGNRKGTGREQEGNRKGSTTNEPNPKPKEKDNKKKKNSLGFDALKIRPKWITEEDWKDLILHRRKHPKKPVESQRAYNTLTNQLSQAVERGFTVKQCIDKIVSRSWSGFDASWMKEEDYFSNNTEGKTGTWKTVKR